MTWTYDGLPGTGSTGAKLDAVRFLSGQLSSGDTYLVQDEEISFLLSQDGNIYSAAASIAEHLAGRYGQQADSKKVGDLAITYGQRSKEFATRAAGLRRQAMLRSLTPYAGGISQADKLVQEQDTDRVQPAFAIGMTDIPGGDPQTATSTG